MSDERHDNEERNQELEPNEPNEHNEAVDGAQAQTGPATYLEFQMDDVHVTQVSPGAEPTSLGTQPAPPEAAMDHFMQIKGVQGESEDHAADGGHSNWVDLDPVGTGTLREPGQLSDDSEDETAAAYVLPNATVASYQVGGVDDDAPIPTPGGEPSLAFGTGEASEEYVVDMADVMITSYQPNANGNDEAQPEPTSLGATGDTDEVLGEEVSINFARVEYDYLSEGGAAQTVDSVDAAPLDEVFDA